VLPGIGSIATFAMLLPATYTMSPVGGLIMLAGIYYGAQYGGSTTAILINLPGEISSVVTCIDGYQMARNGRAGVALTTAALGSFFAGCVGTLLLATLAVPLTDLAFKFGPVEYFSLMVLGLTSAVVLSSRSLVKAIAMVCLGLLGGVVGIDINSGVPRYTFNILELFDGIGIVIVAMGVWGFAEIIRNLEEQEERHEGVFIKKLTTLFPTKADFKRMIAPIFRSTVLGTVVGIFSGGAASIAALGSYALEKKISKHSAEFGKGAIEGVAAPEAANNAATQISFLSLLTLGIPCNASMAMMMGAMMIHNIQPGPQVMTNNPELFWGLIVSMWVGNLMLVVLNLPMVGIWVQLLKIPYRCLYPAILVFCCIGIYSVNYNTLEVVMSTGFGLLGYLFYKLDFEPVPMLLAFILGPMMEENLRRSLLLSHGDFSVLITRPLSLMMLLIAAMLFVVIIVSSIRSKRKKPFHAEEEAGQG
jgi:TctA family transporter